MLEYVQEALVKIFVTTITAVRLVSEMKRARGQIRTSFNAFDRVHTVYIKTRCKLRCKYIRLIPCVNHMLLKLQHVSVTQDHVQGCTILKDTT
jgi:hypothetical protein